MSHIDFLVCFGLATGTTLALGWNMYPLAAFLFMLLLIGLVGMTIHHIRMPQPRFIFAVEADEKENEESSE
jgi:hypothetical protein